MPKRYIYAYGYKMPGTHLKYLMDVEQVRRGIRRAIFDCKCGNYFITDVRAVVNKTTKSCGCHRRETTTKRLTTHGQAKVGHETGSYKAWLSMNSRVANKEHYANVKICDRWSGDNGFQNFYEDMGERPEWPNNTLERLDNTKGYFKENCRWASQAEQTRNTSRNVFVTLNGETKIMAEWARFYKIPCGVVSDRKGKLGWSWEETFFTPYVQGKQTGRSQ